MFGAVVNLTPFRTVKHGIVAYRSFSKGSCLGDAGAIWLYDHQNRFSSVATLLLLPKAATRQNAWRFPGGGKRKIGVRVRCTWFTQFGKEEGDWGRREWYSPPEARRDGREGFGKEEGDWGRREWIKRSGGLGAPQKQDVTEEKGLEKKRGIEGEGSGLKEAGGLGGTQPLGREWFGSKYL